MGPGKASTPTTPAMMEAQESTLCPQPRRPYPPPSPGEEYGLRSPGNEFRELLDGKDASCRPGSVGSVPRDGNSSIRPISEMSTSAGATPCPDDRSSPNPWPATPATPDSHRASPSGQVGNDRRAVRRVAGSAARAMNLEEGTAQALGLGHSTTGPSTIAPAGGSSRQVGKVFVGGVPQDMNGDDLYNVFIEYGGVKKAWLQSYRTVGRGVQSSSHNHRGFGFVIFYDASSVDNLIGRGQSRFLSLSDGRRLEVKRAVPSSDLPGKPGPGGMPPPMLADARSGRGGRGTGVDAVRGNPGPVSPPAPAISAKGALQSSQAAFQVPGAPPLGAAAGIWSGSGVQSASATWPNPDTRVPWPTYMPQQHLNQMAMPSMQHNLPPHQPQHPGMMIAQMPYHPSNVMYQPLAQSGGPMPPLQAQPQMQGLPQQQSPQQNHQSSQLAQPLHQPSQQAPPGGGYYLMPNMPIAGAQGGPAAQQARMGF